MSAVAPQEDLTRLADTANAEHAAFETTQTAALAHAIAAGEALIEAKSMLGHGEWLQWVEAHCDFGERTAQRYIVLARNASRVSHLPTVRDALAALVEPSLPPPPPPSGFDRRTGAPRPTRVVVPSLEPAKPLGKSKPHWDWSYCWLRVPWVTECPCCGADLYASHGTTENDQP